MGLQITSRHRKKIEAWKKQLIEIQDIKIPRRLSNLDLKKCESVTTNANEGSHLPINIDPELSKHQGAATPLTQPCSSVSNGGARLEPRDETSSHQQAETSSMQPCSRVSNGGGGLKLRAETSGHQQAETSSMQPCSRVSDGEAGVEPRVETLELPDDLTSDVELQQPAPRRSRYGRLVKHRKGLVDFC
ncbi:hypothetical protein TNCT_352691 [Trichonephila clavata]|uniref:Uncharacterized protein n=1 Tax=Trichonephila clavata TaxID=2740835 RepID=A0A8X6GKD6_TRICU|nr:hypothetical protein TNCT_352691 [Trichonephila clavata]